MAVGTVAAPTLADAERAAAALAGAGAGRVVLFGSVARGDATERSDIDLVAIFDDLDYGKRWERRCELVRLAGEAAGHSVDVSVTDRAEWAMRTSRVLTSFEGRASRDGVVLVDRPAVVDVDWGKEMVMPDSDYEEALARLEGARNALAELLLHLRPDPIEQGGLDEEEASARRQTRLHRGCGDAHMAVELALKALIHLGADLDRPAWGHDIRKLCTQLPEPHRSVLPSLLTPFGADAITPWRVAAVYNNTDTTPELLADLARIACRVVSYAAEVGLQGRLLQGCGHAQKAVETALKSLVHLGSDPARPVWGRDIGELCAQLAEPHRSALPALLAPLGADAITPWHTDAVYHRAGRDPEATPELLAELARTACRVVSYTADQFPAGAAVAVRAYVELIEDYLDGYEDYLDGYALDTGEPLRR